MQAVNDNGECNTGWLYLVACRMHEKIVQPTEGQLTRCAVIQSFAHDCAALTRINLMRAHIKIGRVFGIEVGLHLSWFTTALLITLSLADQFHAINPDWEEGVIWATAITTGPLFFFTIILHELSHALVAKARNLPVRSITLFERTELTERGVSL